MWDSFFFITIYSKQLSRYKRRGNQDTSNPPVCKGQSPDSCNPPVCKGQSTDSYGGLLSTSQPGSVCILYPDCKGRKSSDVVSILVFQYSPAKTRYCQLNTPDPSLNIYSVACSEISLSCILSMEPQGSVRVRRTAWLAAGRLGSLETLSKVVLSKRWLLSLKAR